MNRSILNYIIDVGLAITFLISAVTGIIKFPELTKYFRAVYLTIPARTLNFLHDWSGIVMTALVLVHIILHWKWIVAMTKKIFGKKK